MSFRGEEIAEAVRDIVVGGGEEDIELDELCSRVERNLGFSLTPEQRDLVATVLNTCRMEVAFP